MDWKKGYDRKRTTAAEAIRHTHTAIMLSVSGRPPGIIMVTSPNPGDGKTAFRLAVYVHLLLLHQYDQQHLP